MFAWHVITYDFGNLLGIDARIYFRATVAWLAGEDPWNVSVNGFAFASLPPTLLPFVPLTAFPEDAAVIAVIAMSIAASVWSVIRLGLSWWWLLFPPLLEGIAVGSVQPIVLALLIGGRGSFAVVAKAFAAFPLLLSLRIKELVAAAFMVLLTAPFLPWAMFLDEVSLISRNALAAASPSGVSVWSTPALIIPVAATLILVGRVRLPWLSVPILWPGIQLHYSILALPAMTPGLAFWFALPTRSAPTVGLLVWAVTVALAGWAGRRRPRG